MQPELANFGLHPDQQEVGIGHIGQCEGSASTTTFKTHVKTTPNTMPWGLDVWCRKE